MKEDRGNGRAGAGEVEEVRESGRVNRAGRVRAGSSGERSYIRDRYSRKGPVQKEVM